MSLRKQALQAMFWIAFARYAAKVMTLLTQLVLARLLAPEAFGLVAVASVVINAMQIFQDMGVGRTLIARRDDRPEALDATFFMAATTGAALCLAMLAFAPLSARFFAEPETAPLLRLLSVKLVISSLGTVPTALLQRDLKFIPPFRCNCRSIITVHDLAFLLLKDRETRTRSRAAATSEAYCLASVE